MIESMVERVAKAIEQVIDRYPAVDASPSRIREIRAGWIARAAISAMAEPTEAMLRTLVNEVTPSDWQEGREAADNWRHMISAALAD